VEKTSQALREGQPGIRKNIHDMITAPFSSVLSSDGSSEASLALSPTVSSAPPLQQNDMRRPSFTASCAHTFRFDGAKAKSDSRLLATDRSMPRFASARSVHDAPDSLDDEMDMEEVNDLIYQTFAPAHCADLRQESRSIHFDQRFRTECHTDQARHNFARDDRLVCMAYAKETLLPPRSTPRHSE